jgi:hypothetical protein
MEQLDGCWEAFDLGTQEAIERAFRVGSSVERIDLTPTVLASKQLVIDLQGFTVEDVSKGWWQTTATQHRLRRAVYQDGPQSPFSYRSVTTSGRHVEIRAQGLDERGFRGAEIDPFRECRSFSKAQTDVTDMWYELGVYIVDESTSKGKREHTIEGRFVDLRQKYSSLPQQLPGCHAKFPPSVNRDDLEDARVHVDDPSKANERKRQLCQFFAALLVDGQGGSSYSKHNPHSAVCTKLGIAPEAQQRLANVKLGLTEERARTAAVNVFTSASGSYSLNMINSDDGRYEEIQRLLQRSWAKTETYKLEAVEAVCLVDNPSLQARYDAYRGQLAARPDVADDGGEKLLFHGTAQVGRCDGLHGMCDTRECALCNICRAGFDSSRWSSASATGWQRFGNGFCKSLV